MDAASQQTRTGGRPRRASATPWGRIAAIAASIAVATTALTWPSPRWRNDPSAFAREVLGAEPWSKQDEILAALVPPRSRVAVKSGHKVGKSTLAAIAALWFYGSFEDARVCMTSTTARQVDAILYREVRKLFRAAKLPLDGEPAVLARSGIKAPDFRELTGFTAREPEAVAGISGKNILYIVDEASGVADAIFVAIDGNRAAGARLLLLSNPTRTEGEFFEAFESKSHLYKCFTVSSEDTPNAREDREVIPGLAGREWIDEKRIEWGEESPLYQVRVKGEFVRNETGKIISLHALGESQARWEETPATGRLIIGVDPAGPADEGDESAFAARRGMRQVALIAMNGLSAGAHLAHVLGLIAELRTPRDVKPAVVLDSLGKVGAEVLGVFRAYLDAHPDAFDLIALRGSDKARREPQVYEHLRDELWARLAQWMRDGGALLEDTKLDRELTAPQWVGQMNGKLKATDKKILRKMLGRSPDRGDATCLMAWEPASWDEPDVQQTVARGAGSDDDDDDVGGHSDRVFDPYGGRLS